MSYLIELIDNEPICLESSNCDTIKSLSDLAKAILASKSKLLDWINSSVVLVLPESYSKVIPSFAISAALSWDSVAINTLSDDWYLDQALVVSEIALFSASWESSKNLCFFKFDFFIEEKFPDLVDKIDNVLWDSYETFISPFDKFHFHTFICQIKVKELQRLKYLEVTYNPLDGKVNSDFEWYEEQEEFYPKKEIEDASEARN